MRLAGREWRTRISAVRLGRDEYRVVRPEGPVGHASLHTGYLGAQYSVDHAAAVDLAIAWWLAARSPRSLIHLPLRSSAFRCGEEYMGRRLDLVLLHHSLGFRVSRWKEVRTRSAPSKIHKVTMPEGALPRFTREEHHRRFHREFRDHLSWAVAADTLFLVGSRRAFEAGADQLRELAEDCPSHLSEDPEAHCCAEIDMGVWKPHAAHRRNPAAMLHIAACNEHW